VRQATCSGGQVPANVTASLAMGEALSVLFARLRGRFGGVLYRHHIPADDGEDLVQTTLLLAVAKWNHIRDPEAWLIGTLHKRCILYWRTRWSHTEYTRPFEELDREPSVEPDQTHRERFADLGKVWHCLPPAQRKLLLLRFREGMSPREAAQAVGLAYSSVRKTTNRACERLREALGTAPPRGTPGGQRAPRRPAAAPGLAKRLRAEGGAAAAWMAAVDAFTAVKAPHLRAQHLRDLAGAGIALGLPSLAELRIEDLPCFRLTLAGKAPALRSQILYSLRSFLLWAGERGDHALQPDAVCQALRVGETFRREAAGTQASAEWRAAVAAFLAVSTVSAHTQRQYRHHLFKAGAAMEWPALAAVTESDLLAFRAALLADGRAAGTHYGQLVVVRCFLLWVREQGGMAVHREVIRAVLQSWDPRRQRPPLADGAGRAAPTPALAQLAGHAAAREAHCGEDLAGDRAPRGGPA
jgi:RNA polymerase sigma factor (sigma-70 family)